MAKRLPVPKELLHLIEKRETADRRINQRREAAPAETGTGSAAPSPQAAAASETTPPAPSRRKQSDRRATGRRKSDPA